MKRYRITTWEAIAFGILATTLAGLGFWQMAHQIRGTLLIVCPGFALTVLLWLGSDGTIEGLAEWVHARPARIAVAPAGLWLLYMAYAAGTGTAGVRPALTMAAYLAVPFLAMSFTARAEPLVILWLWLPLELGVIRSVLIMSTTGLDLHYVLAQLLALDAGVIAFAVWNRTPSIGYRFETDQKILSTGLIHFVLFAAIAIPLGLAIGFIQYSFVTSKLYTAPLLFIGIFLFTALPDDLYRHHPAHLAPAIYISRIWIHSSWNPGSHIRCASRWLAESRIRITRIRIRHESSLRSNHDPFHGVRPRRHGLWCVQGPFDIELDHAVRL